ncbi:MAG TPA: hypothetical protein VF003_10435 [Pseudonocardiaceae bacterium]
MPYDHEADRELVQQTFSREWDEPVRVVRVKEFVPHFKVPGRQANGAPSSEHRVRRFLSSVGKTLHFMVALGAGVFFNGNLAGPSIATYRGRVRGPEGSSAVQFAETVRGESFWLVVSASGLAAVKPGSSSVMWSAIGPNRPQQDRDAGTLLWPDGSRVSFHLDAAESQRLVGV